MARAAARCASPTAARSGYAALAVRCASLSVSPREPPAHDLRRRPDDREREQPDRVLEPDADQRDGRARALAHDEVDLCAAPTLALPKWEWLKWEWLTWEWLKWEWLKC